MQVGYFAALSGGQGVQQQPCVLMTLRLCLSRFTLFSIYQPILMCESKKNTFWYNVILLKVMANQIIEQRSRHRWHVTTSCYSVKRSHCVPAVSMRMETSWELHHFVHIRICRQGHADWRLEKVSGAVGGLASACCALMIKDTLMFILLENRKSALYAFPMKWDEPCSSGHVAQSFSWTRPTGSHSGLLHITSYDSTDFTLLTWYDSNKKGQHMCNLRM